jgi:hypothetical protein
LTVRPNRRIRSVRLDSTVRRKNPRIPISLIVGHSGLLSILKIMTYLTGLKVRAIVSIRSRIRFRIIVQNVTVGRFVRTVLAK